MKLPYAIAFLLLAHSNMSGQCHPDRHSTDWFAGWASCTVAPSPNPERGDGHWILYDFGKTYELGQMHVWNSNDPSSLDWGLREVIIDVSNDGIAWQHVGNFQFQQASGLSTYEGFQGPDLGGAEGRYLLITGETNWGGACFGLSEVRIHAEEVIISSVEDLVSNACFSIAVAPNPFSSTAHLTIDSACDGDFRYTITDALGRTVRTGTQPGLRGTFHVDLRLADLPQGTYFCKVTQNSATAQMTLVKLNRS